MVDQAEAMQDIFDQPSGGAEPHARIVEIEARIEELGDYIERCRKAMQLSRAAMLAGAVLLAAAFSGLARGHGALAGIGGFAAMIGGFVWLGANKSSAEEARARLRQALEERARAIDALGLQELN